MSDLPSASSIDPRNAQRKLLLVRILGIFPFLLFAVCYACSEPLRDSINLGIGHLSGGDREGLREWAAGLGLWAPLATSFLMVVQALAAPIPAVLITITNSILFGPFRGGLLSIASATFAAWICFLIARLYGEPVVRRIASEKALARANGFLERFGAAAVLSARLVPVVPFDPISYLAGLSRMSAWTFLWATFAGQIPAGMAYSYAAQQDSLWRFVAIGGGGFVALLVIGFTARRALLGKRAGGGAGP